MPDGETGGFLERLRNSPRTVSTIIVVLIVVGAIFAFSDRGDQPAPSPTPPPTETPATEASPTPESAATPAPGAAEAEQARETGATPQPTPLPEAQETDEAYVEVAGSGEGVTHLARRAMLRNLEATSPDFTVTAEHKIWIEDYIKDRLGSKPLALGENRTIEKSLVREGVGKSKELTDAQLKQLQRYSRLVAAYR